MNTLRTEDGGWKMADGWKMALLVCFYLLSPIFYLQTETARAAANTNLLGAVFNRTNGMFVAPTNAQFATLTVGAMTVTNFTSFSNNHAVVNGVFFTNLIAAKAYAVAGDTVRVMPGIYRTNNLLKAGVNWFFYPGANIFYTNSGLDSGRAIFDDRDIVGGYQGSIGGLGTFMYSTGLGGWVSNTIPTTGDTAWTGQDPVTYPTNILQQMGAIGCTNPASDFTFQAKKIAFTTLVPLTYIVTIPIPNGTNRIRLAGINIRNCARVSVTVDEMDDPYFGINIKYGNDEFGQLGTIPASGMVYWEKGELSVHCKNNQHAGGYAIEAFEPNTGATNDFYYEGDVLEGDVRHFGSNATHVTRFKVKKWIQKTVINDHIGGYAAIYLDGGTMHCEVGEFTSDDIDKPIVFANSDSSSSRLRLTAQRLANKSAWIYAAVNSGAVMHFTVQEWAELPHGAEAFLGIFNDGSTIEIHGGIAAITNGIGVWHQSGTTRLNGLRIDTSAPSSTNSPVFVAGSATTAASPSGLSLRNAWLTAPAEGYPVNATNAQSVRTIGSAANTNSSANVTFTVGTMTVHGTVQ